MSTKLERRIFTTEFRTVKTGKATTLTGYGAVFNSDSKDLGGFIERIAPGAFRDVLAAGPDCVCLLNHEESALLGRTKSGTLTLSEDEKGLRYDCVAPDTQLGRDVLVLADRGDLCSSSFSFRVDSSPGSQRWYDKTGREVQQWSGDAVRRTIFKIGVLHDVSVVTTPAYPDASVQARSLFFFPEGRGSVDTGDARANAKAKFAAQTSLNNSRRTLEADAARRDGLRTIELHRVQKLRNELL